MAKNGAGDIAYFTSVRDGLYRQKRH